MPFLGYVPVSPQQVLNRSHFGSVLDETYDSMAYGQPMSRWALARRRDLGHVLHTKRCLQFSHFELVPKYHKEGFDERKQAA